MKLPHVRSIIANTPFVGKYIFPFRHNHAIFHDRGKLYSNAYRQVNLTKKNGKIAIVGLPKSGNVWLMSLIAGCLDLEIVNSGMDSHKKGVCMFHTPFSRKVYLRSDLIAGVYIIRDIRDIIVSYYHYSKTEDYRKFEDPTAYFNDIESFYYEYFLPKVVHRYEWINHPVDYVEHGLTLVTYESLWDDTKKELEKIFHHWNLPISREKIVESVDNNKIEKMSKNGKQVWRKIPVTHFRKGGYGGYKNELPEQVLNDINERFSDYLKRWGYTI